MKNSVYGIAIGNSIKKVSLEELVHALIAHEFKMVWYVEKGSKRILVNFLAHTSKRILNNGKQVVKRLISEVTFTEVEDYKKIIVYNHIKEILSYTNNEDETTRYENTFTFLVLKGIDAVLEKTVEAIIKKYNSGQV